MRHLNFLLSVLLAACTPFATALPAAEVPPMPQTIHYLALGDSYTIGESVRADERWPNQLATLLEEAPGLGNLDMEVTFVARTGWTTDELWEGIQAQPIEPPYDLVSLLIGVNNQYRGRDLNEYREQFTFLLNKAVEYAGGNADKVIVLSIPDWGVTPFAADRDRNQITKAIDAFNAVNKAETEKAGAHYVDITPVSRTATSDPALIAEDGLHPSGKMYAEWAQLALPVVLEILKR